MANYYTDMSIWDVHRTEFPWLTLYKPDVMTDIVKLNFQVELINRSLLLMFDEGGDLPRWPLANGFFFSS